MNQDLSIFTLVTQASFVVQVVRAGLLVASLASWTVIFGKLFGLKRVRGDNEEFERELNRALGAGLASAKDRALAQKHLAFVYCSSQRIKPCESAFRAARAADAEFALSRAEAGPPLWGPVYKRVVAAP